MSYRKILLDLLLDKNYSENIAFNSRVYEELVSACKFSRSENIIKKYISNCSNVPEGIHKKLDDVDIARKYKSFITFNEGLKLQRILDEKKIKHCFLKGIFLNQHIYSSIDERHIRDIDLLIEEQDLNQVYETFNINGYKANNNASTVILEDETNYLPGLINSKNVKIDLHTRILPKKNFDKCLLSELMLKGKYQIKKNNYEAHFIHLIYHSALKEMLTNGFIVIKDLYRISNVQDFKREEVLEISEKIKLKPLVIEHLKLIDSLKKNKLPQDVKKLADLTIFNKSNKTLSNIMCNNPINNLKKLISTRSVMRKHQVRGQNLNFIFFFLRRFFYLIALFLFSILHLVISGGLNDQIKVVKFLRRYQIND